MAWLLENLPLVHLVVIMVYGSEATLLRVQKGTLGNEGTKKLKWPQPDTLT